MNFFENPFKKKDVPFQPEFKAEPYRKGTMEDFRMPKGGRGLKNYEDALMFKKKELEDKSVLDLGAGPELKLAKDLEEAGITKNVTSLSPDFAEKKYAEQAQISMQDSELVAGIGQQLPFQNESFDNIFAFHVSEHLNDTQFLEVISEMARTLRVSGKAIIGPTSNEENWKPYEAILENKDLKKKLDKLYIEVEKVMIPEEIIKPRRLKNDFGQKYYEPGFNIVLRKIIKTK